MVNVNKDTSIVYDVIMSDDRFFLSAIDASTKDELISHYRQYSKSFIDELDDVNYDLIEWTKLLKALKHMSGQVEIPETE